MKKLMVLSLAFLASFAAVVWVTGEFLRPVHGQGTLSNADIVGSYAFNLVGSSGDQIQFNVPGTLNQGVPLNVVPNGTPGAFCAPNIPCFEVNFANPAPQLSFPIAEPMSIAGQFVADGAGNITSGSGFVFSQTLHTTDGMTYTVVDKSCNFALTGTYSIASGTSTLTVNPVGPCITPGLSATFNLLPGNAERRDGVEFGVMHLNAPIANSGTFSTFLNGSFFKQ
jgi:hypothetical protein